MRAAPLTTIKGGINRLRTKGGARADALYDLVNGYVTESDTVHVRPGTERVAQLSVFTKGLTGFRDELHVFSHTSVAVPSGFQLNILVHPDSNPSDEIALLDIHFAEPFMGALYVVAEFEDGQIFHYWLQEGTQWEANKHYNAGDLVYPSVETGLVYQATRLGDPNPTWAPNVPRFDGTGTGYEAQSVVEPTVYNDFYYTCVETVGNNPRSGTTEPEWPTEDGARITESVDGGDVVGNTPTTAAPSTGQPNSGTQERYGRFNVNKGRVQPP